MFTIKYLCSTIYDLIILIVLFFAFTALVLLLTDGNAIPPSSLWYQLSLLSLSFFYYFFSIRFGGQTIGMKAWGFKLINGSNEQPSYKQIAIRYVGFFPAILVSVIYFEWSYTLLNEWSKSYLVN